MDINGSNTCLPTVSPNTTINCTNYDPNCNLCDQNNCTGCGTGYQVDLNGSNTCIAISNTIPNISNNCSIFNINCNLCNQTNCLGCNSGYFLDTNGYNICNQTSNISIPNNYNYKI